MTQLAGNDKYKQMLEDIEDARPVGDFEKDEFIGWLTDLAFARALLRDYAGAADAAKDALEIEPNHPLLHVNYADFLGRMNRYQEAADESRAGLALAGGAAEMAELFYVTAAQSLAMWEWALGEKAHASELMENINLPGEPLDAWMCRSQRCVFWAVTGEEEMLQEEIAAAFALLPECEDLDEEEARTFFERDIVYDPYREKDWFIARFGKTSV